MPLRPATTARFARPTHSAVPRYQAIWDAYSDEWDANAYYRQFRFLGDEWGTDDWVNYNLDTFVRPYLTPTSTVLEIGPGGGRYTAAILPHCGRLLAVDTSERMLDRLRRRFVNQPRLEIAHGDGTSLRGIEDASMDLAYSFNVFVQLELVDIYNYLCELQRVLRHGGVATLQYAQINSDAGFAYFDGHRFAWSARPEQRGRFTELTLDMMDRLVDRAGLVCRRNQIVARDAVVVVEKPAARGLGPTPAAVQRSTPATSGSRATRRDYGHIDRYLDMLAADIYHEAPTDHHRAAAHDAIDTLIADLEVEHVLELGCGAAPALDRAAALGMQTTGVTLGEEPCAHALIRADIHFTQLPTASTDVIVARHILEHSPMPLLLLMEMHRITRRYALVVVPCDEQIWVDWPNHYSVLSQPMWRKLFDRAGFSLLRQTEGPLIPDSKEWRFLLERKRESEIGSNDEPEPTQGHDRGPHDS